ncbi:hypothetical protein R80B4_00032 [Fibrobacteres bacterium R8-0-B4]
MSISKTAVKLAAAALAVAGVTGAVWAQTSPVTAASVSQGKMVATFTVGGSSEIECIPKNPTEDVLLATDVTKPELADPGTLGQVVVRTNSTAWDVSMTTNYGGRLVKTSSKTYVPPVCDAPDPFDPSGCLGNMVAQDSADGSVTDVLVYSTTGTATGPGVITSTILDTVQLEVAIGLAKLGDEIAPGSPSATGNVYSFGAPTDYNTLSYLAPVKVLNTALTGSRTLKINASEASPPTTVGIGFAAVLGAATAYGDASNVGAYSTQYTATGGGSAGRAWTGTGGIFTSGFGTPKYKATNAAGKTVGQEYFFINVGFLPTLTQKIGNNVKGDYQETFIFDLVSAF